MEFSLAFPMEFILALREGWEQSRGEHGSDKTTAKNKTKRKIGQNFLATIGLIVQFGRSELYISETTFHLFQEPKEVTWPSLIAVRTKL